MGLEFDPDKFSLGTPKFKPEYPDEPKTGAKLPTTDDIRTAIKNLAKQGKLDTYFDQESAEAAKKAKGSTETTAKDNKKAADVTANTSNPRDIRDYIEKKQKNGESLTEFEKMMLEYEDGLAACKKRGVEPKTIVRPGGMVEVVKPRTEKEDKEINKKRMATQARNGMSYWDAVGTINKIRQGIGKVFGTNSWKTLTDNEIIQVLKARGRNAEAAEYAAAVEAKAELEKTHPEIAETDADMYNEEWINGTNTRSIAGAKSIVTGGLR